MKNRITYANVTATLALCFALTGTAVAAKVLITSSKQVKDGTLTGADIRDGSIGKKDLAKDVLTNSTSGTGGQGSVGAQGSTGPAGAQGSTGNNGVNGANGSARAYGLVRSDGTVVAAKSQGITVTKPNMTNGIYCVGLLAGVDATKSEPAITVNRADSSTSFAGTGDDDFNLATFVADRPNCNADQIQVRTFLMNFTAGTFDGTQQADVGFSIVVP